MILIETHKTIPEDPRAAHQRYKDALAECSVSIKIMKILIIGAAGVGKTHLLHLMLKETPPNVRHSTPVMKKPVQVIQTALKNSSMMKRVTDRELYELLANFVNTSARLNAEISPFHYIPASAVATDALSKLSIPSVGPSLHGNKSTYSSDVENSKLSLNVGGSRVQHVNNSDDPFELLEVEKQLVPLIANTKDTTHDLDTDWIYFIDSGGEPQFHQLLPAFVRHTNLNIFVLRLCDKLSAHPTIEYYYGSGTCDSSIPIAMTNKQILQRCAQATQTVDQDGDSRLLIVGTHRDLEHQCKEETRDDKNKQLVELLIPSMKNHLMFCNEDSGDIIFPLNAKVQDDSDRNITSDLYKCIQEFKESINPIPIPLRWLVFHQEIQTRSNKTKSDVFEFEQCIQLASRLHMVDDTKAALQFFSDLNVIMYFPQISNVVFTNPQSFLNIVTQIIVQIVYNKGSKDPLFSRARNEGIISVKLIELLKIDFPKGLKSSRFEAKDLISLLLHLGIVSKCNSEYFMPSLLKDQETKDIEILLPLHPDTVAPCAVYNEKRWMECGAFGFLITSLLSSGRWTLAFDRLKPLCLYSNCIQMYFKSILVTLVDYVSHIEIHIHGNMDCCRMYCSDIKQSIFDSFKVKPQLGLVCPCGSAERHVAKITLKSKRAFCSKNQLQTFPWNSFGVTPEVWIGGKLHCYI